MKLSVIVAAAENGIIGRDGDLPWHLSADLKRFKRLTTGHVILMGRKTWESIGRPLPGRTSIVISRQSNYETGFPEVLVASNLDQALALARNAKRNSGEAFVIGGARIYEMSLPRADQLLFTRVHAEVKGDVAFPDVTWEQWKLIEEERVPADDKNDFAHSFQKYERIV